MRDHQMPRDQRTQPTGAAGDQDRPRRIEGRRGAVGLAVRDGDYKLLINEDGSSPQLYDLSTDLKEKNNLASDKPDIVQRLKGMVLDWRKSMPAEHVTANAQAPRVDVQNDGG